MGEIYAKPVQDELLTQLQLRYEPQSQSKQIPGEPTHLKIISEPSIVSPMTQLSKKYPKIDRYSLTLKLNEQNWRNQKNIYEYRKTNYPCLVQVIHFELQKQQCECITHGYKLAVFTQYVETRLANFKLTKSGKRNQYKEAQQYDSFTLDQGIYVLINTLHAYQLLCEQYWVNYPTPFTIGITWRAKVKVWINENWALNTPNNRKITQNLIIEEIINLIEERMDGTFSKILNYKYNYMNFNFDFIQDILSTYTINFHKGKQTLQEKIHAKSNTEEGYPRNFQDQLQITAKGKLQRDNFHGNSEKQRKVEFEDEKQIEKRHFSQQCIKNSNSSNHILLPPSYSCRKPIQTPKSSAVSQSPKKNIKFMYQPHEPSLKTLSKFSVSSKQSCPLTSENSISFRNPCNKHSNIVNSHINFTVSNQAKIPSEQTALNYLNPLKRMDKKPFQNIKSQQQEKIYSNSSSNSNKQANKNQSPIRTFLDYAISHGSNEYSSSNHSQKDSSRRISYEFTEEPMMQPASEKIGETLSSITEQFKNLLQLSKKTDPDEDPKQFQAYNEYHMATRIEQIDGRQQKRNQTISFGRQFEQIKEQDQDVNYSFDQNI